MFPLRKSSSCYNVMPFNGHLYCCSRFEVYLFPTAKERKALLHQKYTVSIPFKLYLECTATHAVH